MADQPSTGSRLNVVRVIGVLERGGAQLSALRLSVALRSHGIVTRLYAGDATAEGLALAAAFDVPAEAFARQAHLQWVPSTDFASCCSSSDENGTSSSSSSRIGAGRFVISA